MVVERVVNRVFQILPAGREIDELFRPAVHLPALEVHDAASQRPVGGELLLGAERGLHVQAPGVGFVAVLGKHQLADHLSHVFGVDGVDVGPGLDFEHLIAGGLGLCVGDETVLQHPVDDVPLARLGASRVADGVVGRGGLGQSGEHGGFGNGHILQGFTKVGFRGSGKAVGPVAQKDLVHVDLEDLVLGEHVLELEGQQDFIDLAGERFLGAEVHIARHLHGDGGCALAPGAAHIGQPRADHAHIVHPAMLVEACVLHCQNGIGHGLGDFFDGGELAALFAELADQLALYRVDAQRQLGPVVREVADVRQVGVGHGERQGDQGQERQATRYSQTYQPEQGDQRPVS